MIEAILKIIFATLLLMAIIAVAGVQGMSDEKRKAFGHGPKGQGR
jgi:Tfp pilus assembly protein PilX